MTDWLLLNIGNTHTQWAWCRDGVPGPSSSRGTAEWLREPVLLPASRNRVWAVSVVPEARRRLEETGYYPELRWADAAAAERAGLKLRRMDTATLGMDRIANAAALLRGELPAAVLDAGTAITLEMVGCDREFLGGAIAPGRALLRKSLAEGTAALPLLPWRTEIPDDLGCNTLDAMAVGVDRGAVGMMRELVRLARDNGARRIVLCGGDASFFLPAFPELEPGGELFTLSGVAYIAGRQGPRAERGGAPSGGRFARKSG